METIQYNLPQDRIPRAWYNILPDLPAPLAPPLHPGTLQPIGPDDLAPLFPMGLILQEVSAEREIEMRPMPARPCWVEISTRALGNNYRSHASLAPPSSELLAIVKADAYGHSLALCAPAAVRAGARWLGVTSVEEGVAARGLCRDARILVMGGIFPGQGNALLEHRLTPVVWTPD